MDPVRVAVTIDKPREEVFDYLADIANHPEFLDHFIKDWRLLRVDSFGKGAGARFRVEAPLSRFSWGDVTFVEVLPPHRIVGVGRGGKYNRIKTFYQWTLDPAPGGGTRVELEFEAEPVMPSDRIMEFIARRGWFKRKAKKGLRRLQSILEEGRGRGTRASVAGL